MVNKAKTSKKMALFIGETQITDYVFDEIIDEKENIIIFSSEKTIFWYNKETGEKITEVKDVISYEWYKRGIVIKKKSGYKLYSFEGKSLLKQLYDLIEKNGEYFEVYKNGKKGIYDGDKHKFILKPEFDTIVIEPDYFFVKDNNKRGIYSKNGKRIVSVIYEYIDVKYTLEDIFFIPTLEDGRRKVYSFGGKEIIPLDYYYNIDIMNRNYIITAGNRYNLYSHEGEILYESGLICERLNSKVIVVGDIYSKCAYSISTGKKIITDAQEIKLLYDDMLLVIKNDKFGVYSMDGKEILSCDYDNIIDTNLSRTLHAQKQDESYFYFIIEAKLFKADAMSRNRITGELSFLCDGKWVKSKDIK